MLTTYKRTINPDTQFIAYCVFNYIQLSLQYKRIKITKYGNRGNPSSNYDSSAT